MAKAKRGAEDLDAELAALEAELAKLGEKKAKKAAAPPPPPPPAPAAEPAPPAADVVPTSEPEPERKKAKKRFGFGRKERAEPAPEPAPPAPAPTPAPALAPAPAPRSDPSQWRQEDGAWVRQIPHESVVVRRVLDERGAVVREESASMADLEEKTPVKAERGLGKFLKRRSS